MTAPRSSASAMAGSAPRSLNSGTLEINLVIPVTRWPAETRIGMRRLPKAPVAPARKIRIPVGWRRNADRCSGWRAELPERRAEAREYNARVRFSTMITAVDAHACGEPGRVITGGVLDVPGRTMFEKKTWLETHADHLRKRMLREPRGYPAANCNLILQPTHPEADAGFVIMEQVEYPPMSGTNTICVATVLIE